MTRESAKKATSNVTAAAALLGMGLISGVTNAQVVTTVAGSGAEGSADGTGTAASFAYPIGVAVDGTANVYVADTHNNRIRKISPNGVVTTFAGSGAQGSADGIGTAASLNLPFGVAVDGAGNVYVADTNNNKIRKITPDGVVTTVAGSGAQGSADGMGTAASFYWPSGVAVDGTGNLFVADLFNNKIRRITPAGAVTTLAGSGLAGDADGTGTAASFSSPSGVAVDRAGNVYVADYGNDKIRKITPGGVVTVFAGSHYGTATASTFNHPRGVAVDDSDNVCVADTDNHTIRKITPSGDVTTLAGSGLYGHADGPGPNASFYTPRGVAVGGAGDVYVADSDNNRIRKIVQPTAACAQDAFTTCIVGGRYRVTSHWQNQYAGGQLNTLFATRMTDATAAFWLFDASTYEYLIRVNTATDNGRAWIAITTFTDVEFWVAVTDTTSGQYYEYHSPAGNRTLIYDPFFFIYP